MINEVLRTSPPIILKKLHLSTSRNFTSCEIKNYTCLLCIWIPNEDIFACEQTKFNFVWVHVCSKPHAFRNFIVCIKRWHLKLHFMQLLPKRSDVDIWLNKVSNGQYTFAPKFKWWICLKMQSTSNPKKILVFSLEQTILLWCRYTNTLLNDPMVWKKLVRQWIQFHYLYEQCGFYYQIGSQL